MWFQVFSNVLIHSIFQFTKEKRTKKEKVIIVVLLIRISKYKPKGLKYCASCRRQRNFKE